ncbi:hypothetical protein RHMOL_Rhmol07G0191200 [Rhododendron molle]|uniref:Uncharacterized protein n=1 Tax=Rhododendron molle TaxID=49168 RepID=A0ACC0N3D4_RHOML|nr:hypothetical protein RHMOL_Rhmol07G0191200 [Rhododendron molle]
MIKRIPLEDIYSCGCECLIFFIWPRNKSKTIKHGWILLARQEVTIKDGWVEKRAKKVKEISKMELVVARFGALDHLKDNDSGLVTTLGP